MGNISAKDKAIYKKIRSNVSLFIRNAAQRYDKQGTLLDIAPQVHEGARAFFSKAEIKTLDIDPTSGADFIADICVTNSGIIPSSHFDFVVCTEVLEHTRNPFGAAIEIERILKKGGKAFISTPFDFRIHGPLPDCWRFTEHGLKELFKNMEVVELNALEQKGRWLMPLHYTMIVEKRK